MNRFPAAAAATAVLLWFAGRPIVRAEGHLAHGAMPAPTAPANNPQSAAKVHLGAQLYFDTRLSKNNTVSCATCHRPEHGWSDPGKTSTGVGGAKGGRHAPTVLNSAYYTCQFWDGRAKNLEEQALGPVQNPVEMGETLPEVVKRLKGIPGYVSEFRAVFGRGPDAVGVAKAIAAFERTVVARNSSYDRYLRGDKHAMSLSAVRGMSLFNGKAVCVSCHSGPNFTDSAFHNLGVGYSAGKYADRGREAITHNPKDIGAFKTPGLRAVSVSAPYLHDGSEATLAGVIELYDRGGIANPNLDPAIFPLHLAKSEKADLVAFLKAISDEPVIMRAPELPR